tara:strand:+ start:292 stop:852 length:561 start_codon:yes stop_codon:yes gene_type:complete
MFGTELHQAYDQGMNSDLQQRPQHLIHGNNSDINQNGIDEASQQLPNHAPPPPPPPPHHQQGVQYSQQQLQQEENMYETNNFFRDNQMQNQLSKLQEELQHQKQKTTNAVDTNIIDRFISKKKEVFKLILIALTILLAFSLHYIVNDLLKNYMNNNMLSPSQELFTKISYPISVLLLIWTIKVFNK